MPSRALFLPYTKQNHYTWQMVLTSEKRRPPGEKIQVIAATLLLGSVRTSSKLVEASLVRDVLLLAPLLNLHEASKRVSNSSWHSLILNGNWSHIVRWAGIHERPSNARPIKQGVGSKSYGFG